MRGSGNGCHCEFLEGEKEEETCDVVTDSKAMSTGFQEENVFPGLQERMALRISGGRSPY